MSQPVIPSRQKDVKKNISTPVENSQPLQPISAKIEKNLYKDLKILSIRNDKKLNTLIEEALRSYIKNVS